MPKVIFLSSEGGRHELEVSAGTTLMEAALDNNIAGIVAECGGACACATCHVHVAEAWINKLPAVSDMEDAMLDVALDRNASSRLACQIEMTPELDGLELQAADNEG